MRLRLKKKIKNTIGCQVGFLFPTEKLIDHLNGVNDAKIVCQTLCIEDILSYFCGHVNFFGQKYNICRCCLP